MIVVRVLIATAILCAVCLVVNRLDSHPRRDLIGTPVACTSGFPFRGMQAEILEYGLQDVRGLACDASGRNVFVAEGKRSLLIYSAGAGSIMKSKHLACPGAPCDVTDRRGLAFAQPTLYVAEHGRGQMMFRELSSATQGGSTSDPDSLLGLSSPVPGTSGVIASPAGVAVAEQTLFITDDGQVNRWGHPSGALWVCSSTNCKPELAAGDLQYPSGVASAGKNGPVYVVERTANQVRWPIFTRATESSPWIRTAELGSAPANAVSAAFLGLAIDDSRNMLFAAGPGGVYIFGRNGRNSGRMLFDDPVTGVASCGKDVYIAVGHMLCRLRIPG